MIYQIFNAEKGMFEYFQTEQEANTVLQNIHTYVLNRDSYLFYIGKLTDVENGQEWSHADEFSPEEGNYQVFNTLTGLHEPFTSLSLAKNRLEEIKLLHLENLKILNYKVLDSMPPSPIPVKFGPDNGNIPVEIM